MEQSFPNMENNRSETNLEFTDLDNVPSPGMCFESEEELYNFYKGYAFSQGFGVVKRSIHFEGGCTYYTLVCNRNGTHKSKSPNPTRASIRINCKAKINVKVDRNGAYSITKVELKHNHELSPRKSRLFRCNKSLDTNTKRTLELNDEAGIRIHKTINSFVVEAGGYDNLPFGEVECRSYIRKVRELRLITNFKLQDNQWFHSLYTRRTMWVPVYLRKFFWAGMSTTQRSESMNVFFDGYVTSKTSLSQFVREYDNALRYKVEKENKADFNSFAKCLPLVSDIHIEQQFNEVYTHEIMKKFQVELKGLFHCNATYPRMHDSFISYDVIDSVLCKDGVTRRDFIYEVQINEMESTIVCLCGLFEFKGIICRHIVSTMVRHNIHKIPEKYILTRWSKTTKRPHTFIKSSYNDFQNNPTMQRYDELRRICLDVGQYGAISLEHCDLMKTSMVTLKTQLIELKGPIIAENASCEGNSKTKEKLVHSRL